MGAGSLPPTKKRKISTKAEKQGKSTVITDAERLENQLAQAIANNSSLNPLSDLLSLVQTARSAEELSKVIFALYRTFVTLISGGRFTSTDAEDENAKIVRSWLWERLNGFADALGCILQDEDATLRLSALDIQLSMLKHLSNALSISPQGPKPQFHAAFFKTVINALITCPPSPRSQYQSAEESGVKADVRETFLKKWLCVYDDIRWFFLRDAATLIANTSHQHAPANLLSILEHIQSFPTEASQLNSWWIEAFGAKPPKARKGKGKKSKSNSKAGARDVSSSEDEDDEPEPEDVDEDDDWRKFFDDPKPSSKDKKDGPSMRIYKMTIHQSLYSLASHKAVFSRCWLNLLPRLSLTLEEDPEEAKTLSVKALNVMHRGVMPHLTRPVLVMDWVGSCVDQGGAVGVLGLNALFILMQEYNLDYPEFYTRLYSYFDRNVLHSKHRARFFRMTELFLSSTHLPANLLASFVKRLSRLSLHAPPSAIVMVIPFIYNILKRHPALMVLIHRTLDEETEQFNDPFDATEPNPNLTNAIDSSLWELHTQRNHFHSGVSTLAKIFEEPFTKPNYTMEDFLDHTYATLLEADFKRPIKKEPALAMDLPGKTLFIDDPETDENGGGVGTGGSVDVVKELWSFA